MIEKPFPFFVTIAGSDSGGSAGIQADIKTGQSLGVYTASVITATTAQNPAGVVDIHPLPTGHITSQLNVIEDYFQPVVFKTGMIPGEECLQQIYLYLEKISKKRRVYLVLDPVLIATSGASLSHLDPRLMLQLGSLATIMTPNRFEAGILSGFDVKDENTMKKAAQAIFSATDRPALVKGGDFNDHNWSTDLLLGDNNVHTWRAPRIQEVNSHGGGCTFASALASHLSLALANNPHGDFSLVDIISRARCYIQAGLKYSRPFVQGGERFIDHFNAARRASEVKNEIDISMRDR